MPSSKNTEYSKEEADLLLQRAMEKQLRTSQLTYADLEAVAREAGIDSQTLAETAEELERERRERAIIQQHQRRAWNGFIGHLIPFILVNAMQAILMFEHGHMLGFLIPLMGWGIGLLFHLKSVVFFDRNKVIQKAYEVEGKAQEKVRKQEEKERAKAERKQKKNSGSFEESLDEGVNKLEKAVQKGVSVLLHAAADRIENAASKDKPRVRAPGVRVDAAPPPRPDSTPKPQNESEEWEEERPKQKKTF